MWGQVHRKQILFLKTDAAISVPDYSWKEVKKEIIFNAS